MSKVTQPGRVESRGEEGQSAPVGSRAPRLPAFVPAQWPAWLPDISIPMALDALSSDHCRLGGGMGWGQGTINLPACVCVWGCVGDMGMVQDSCAVFLEARLGLRQRQKRGKNCSTRASFLPALGTLSRFQGAGAQATTSDCRRLCSHTSMDSAETSSSITYFKSD